MRPRTCLVIPFLAGSILSAQALSKSAVREAISAAGSVIDDWHLAAAQSEEARYFSHMAPEAVFIGIDEKERWVKEAFQKWAHPGFEGRQIWKFKAIQRNLALSPGGEVAWFDELIDMAGAGTARGSGVLVKQGGTWLIAQYNLSLPIPRQVFGEVLSVVNTQKSAAAAVTEPEKTKQEK